MNANIYPGQFRGAPGCKTENSKLVGREPWSLPAPSLTAMRPHEEDLRWRRLEADDD